MSRFVAGLALTLVCLAAGVALLVSRSNGNDVEHLEGVVQEVAALAEIPASGVDTMTECSTDSAGGTIPRFAQVNALSIDDPAKVVNDLATALRQEGYEDVEPLGARDLIATDGAISIHVTAGERSVRVRASDPLSAC